MRTFSQHARESLQQTKQSLEAAINYGLHLTSLKRLAFQIRHYSGARIKIMRHIDFGVPDQYRRRRTQLEREADQYDSRGLSKKGFMGNSDRQPLLQHEPDVGAAVSSISVFS